MDERGVSYVLSVALMLGVISALCAVFMVYANAYGRSSSSIASVEAEAKLLRLGSSSMLTASFYNPGTIPVQLHELVAIDEAGVAHTYSLTLTLQPKQRVGVNVNGGSFNPPLGAPGRCTLLVRTGAGTLKLSLEAE